ncbi:hypothetical protein G9A89_006356 [Geosiphon pyriformis]|nr:hypothetical protein G9A89_006356 [Geosiphon pyriformis]
MRSGTNHHHRNIDNGQQIKLENSNIYSIRKAARNNRNFNMDLSDQILKLSKQLFETIQKSTSQIEITIDKKEIWYKDKSRRGEDESSIRTKHSLPYPPPKRQCGKKNCLQAGGGKKGGKERKKGYKRRYLVPELKEIKEALAHGTELPETGEWTPDNAQE